MSSSLGLYNEAFESDSCGVGLVVNAKNPPTHQIILNGLKILGNLSHRGALGADGATSDGAGILSQIPDSFFRSELQKHFGRDVLPARGQYAVAQFFVGDEESNHWRQKFAETARKKGFDIFWRDVPVDSLVLGHQARSSEPKTVQAFLNFKRIPTGQINLELFRLRRWAEQVFRSRTFSICSFSAETIVYKGLMRPQDLGSYYLDLKNDLFQSQLALVHSRFSTNTLPAWKLAQPFRFSCHNGEINTIRGNRNWMKAREKELIDTLQVDFQEHSLLTENQSDSNSLDEALELLMLLGKSATESMMCLIPEAWENNLTIPQELKDFYCYQSMRTEPWDGPATVGFCDGAVVGACLDRNGLRPCRYQILRDGTLIASSEAGTLEIPGSEILHKDRLKPGQLIVVDLKSGEMIMDQEAKLQIARKRNYHQLNANERWQPDFTNHPFKNRPNTESATVLNNQTLAQFGFHYDEIMQVLLPLFTEKEEVSSSMGCDTPLALLSDRPQLLFNYFRQLFAQVTNPPIDPIRERSVMSLETFLGPRGSWIASENDGKQRWILEHPILSSQQMSLLHSWTKDSDAVLKTAVLESVFELQNGAPGLESRVQVLCEQAEALVRAGTQVLIVSDKSADSKLAAIPSLLMTSRLHNDLLKKQLRTRVSLVMETGEVRDVHHMACLFSFGADAAHPSLIEGLIQNLRAQNFLPTSLSLQSAWNHYQTAMTKGLLKILSKLGISTLQSYYGAQTFEILGFSKPFVKTYFPGAISRIEGLTLEILTEEVKRRWVTGEAYSKDSHDLSLLATRGDLHYKINGEDHHWNPTTISLLQIATRTRNPQNFQEFSEAIRATERFTLRGHFQFHPVISEIPISEVESAKEIVKRFTTGAMSLGALGQEAHETLAIAMNELKAQSNSGEGGEDENRFDTNRNSSIKQIASARFGVTTNYLVHANELQIKMAQGAKPGEGGQLPGHKVDHDIAKLRHSMPGVTLISPPPHHDIYSIEDLAQLIFDLKNVNPQARISVKLVAKAGVGTIAAGVVKAGADKILISGDGGGTGASPLSSIRYAGAPWELGLAETHQTLNRNSLRKKVKIETDGQLRTGRDVAIAAILGADEFGFSTAPLIVEGCLMMRKCHLNTCPVGIATQDPELRRKFTGQPEHVINYFFFVAEEVREIMATLGVRTLDELVGRTDFLQFTQPKNHWKARELDLTDLLYSAATPEIFRTPSKTNLNEMDAQFFRDQKQFLKTHPEKNSLPVRNTDRSVGTWISGKRTREPKILQPLRQQVHLKMYGSSGQSFGAFLTAGVNLHLIGEANDYVGKGLSGGTIEIQHDPDYKGSASESILIGNTCFYGATSGEAFIAGSAGERFAVRNSGAVAVVEGVGDHGCEYMTGGCVVILGKTGKNFAAGMSGGSAYIWDPEKKFESRCNPALVDIENLVDVADQELLQALIAKHLLKTKSQRAHEILSNWNQSLKYFRKVIPKEYRQVLLQKKTQSQLESVLL
jgi:glutamate synthase (NADPH/NADH) large chain